MKAYIFDLDGTLIDSMDVWEKVDIDFLKKRGITATQDYMDAVSPMNNREAAIYTIERFGLPDSVEELLQEWNEMAAYAYGHTVPMKPHAKEYLTMLRERGAKLAIATSTFPELYKIVLNKYGIFDWFNVICGSDEVGCGKTRPDIFLLTAKKLDVQPSDCMVFEDILPAVKSAKSAGMTVCGIYDQSAKSDWEEIKKTADYTFTDWKDAPMFE